MHMGTAKGALLCAACARLQLHTAGQPRARGFRSQAWYPLVWGGRSLPAEPILKVLLTFVGINAELWAGHTSYRWGPGQTRAARKPSLPNRPAAASCQAHDLQHPHLSPCPAAQRPALGCMVACMMQGNRFVCTQRPFTQGRKGAGCKKGAGCHVKHMLFSRASHQQARMHAGTCTLPTRSVSR